MTPIPRQRSPEVATIPRPTRIGHHLLVTASAMGLAPLASLTAQFQPPACYFAGAGDQPVAMAFGDTTGVGIVNMVSASVGNGTRWFNHFGGGSQPSCPSFLAPTTANAGAPGDIGTLDIGIGDVDPSTPGQEIVALEVAGFGATYRLQVYSGTLPVGPALVLPPTSIQLLVHDFNGDGAADAVVLESTGKVRTFQSALGLLSPAPVTNLTPGVGPTVCMAIGSFDQDHLPDLVIVRGGVGALPARAELWVGNHPSFLPPFVLNASTPLPLGTIWPTPRTACVATGDFDGDGRDDYMIGGSGAGGGAAGLWVGYLLRGIGPSIIYPHGFIAPGNPVAMTTGDFDLDGDIDLAVGAHNGDVYLMKGSGLGSFAMPGTPLRVGGGPAIGDIEACDLDGDGDLDLGISDGVLNGFTCVFCNAADTGRCHHVLRAGVEDNYLDNDVQGSLAQETVYPRGAILPAATRWFDRSVAATPMPLAHTFGGLPTNIVSARLYVKLKEQSPGDNAGGLDRLRLDFAAANDWAFSIPVPVASTELRLDLEDLPSGLNLLPRLQHVGRLDVMVQDYTAVDFMRLEISTRCADHDPVLVYEPSGGIDTYSMDAWVSPGAVNWHIDASPAFAGGLYLLGFAFDPAIGHAPFFSLCLTHVDTMVVGFLDANGAATGVLTLGPGAEGIALSSQAVAFPPGPLVWPLSKWSYTISDRVY